MTAGRARTCTIFAGILAGVLLLAACSGNDDDGAAETSTSPPATATTETTGTPETESTLPPGELAETASAAVVLADLPEGFLVADEGYSNQTETTANFERIFQVASAEVFAPFGGSQVGRIENNVLLFPDVAAAEAYVAASRAGLEGEAGEELIALTLGQTGVGSNAVTIEEMDPALGDDSFAITGYAETDGGLLALGFIVVRIDRTVTALIITGGDPFAIEDLLPLAEASSTRLAALPR